MFVWKCEECGSLHSYNDPPEHCPGCDTPREQFVRVDELRTRTIWDSFTPGASPACNSCRGCQNGGGNSCK